MRKFVYHIFFCVMLLLTATACRETGSNDGADEHAEMVRFKFDVVSKVNALAGEDQPDRLRLWICDQNQQLIYYIEKGTMPWEIVGQNGIDLKATVETEIDISGVQNLNFYLVLNSPLRQTDAGTTEEIPFYAQSPWPQSMESRFVLSPYSGDNAVPMSGLVTDYVLQAGKELAVSIDAIRSVGKLQVYCTRESDLTSLTINSITLKQIPDEGYLFGGYAGNLNLYGSGTQTLFQVEGSGDGNIVTTLPETENSGTNFEANEDQFTLMAQTYIPENLYGGEENRAVVAGSGMSIADQDKRYYVTLDYTLNGLPYIQDIYLPQIPRNTIDKLFVRFTDKGYHCLVDWYVKDWEDGGTLVIPGGTHPTSVFKPYPDETNKDQAWYLSAMDLTTPETMANAARYTFEMQTEHQWNISCDNILDFEYKVFKREGSIGNYTYTDLGNLSTEKAGSGTYVICVYPKNPLEHDTYIPKCTISFSYYNVYFNKWEKLPDDAATATVTQVSATV